MLECFEVVKDGVRECCLRVVEVVVFSKFHIHTEFANAIFNTLIKIRSTDH